MATKSKEQRIRAEKRRLEKIYANLDSQKKLVASGLIQRAAYLKATIEDLEEDLDKNGYTERFCQSDKVDPFERRRPTADLFTSTSGLYQKCIKQLTDLLPKENAEKQTKTETSDGFDEFISVRND